MTLTFVKDDNGNAPVAYLPITLTNAQSGTLISGTPILVTLDSATYSAYEGTTLANVNFQDGAGNLLYSWLESGETNASTSTNYRIKTNAAIGPSSATGTIYAVFVGTALASMSGTHTGAEPKYTGSYAQYDNGTSVWTAYNNFSGTSQPSFWANTNASTTNVTIAYNNGLTITKGSAAASHWGLISASSYTATLSVEISLSNFASSGGTPSLGVGLTTATTFNTSVPSGYYPAYEAVQTKTTTVIAMYTSNTTTGSIASHAATDPTIIGLTWLATGNEVLTVAGVNATSTDSHSTITAALFLYLFEGGSAQSAGGLIQWVRAGQALPSAVQPSVSAGAVVGLAYPAGTENDTSTSVKAIASGLGVGAGTEHETVAEVASGNGVGAGTEHDAVATKTLHQAVSGAGNERMGNFVQGAQIPGLSRLVVSGKGVPAGTEHDSVAAIASGKGVGVGTEHDTILAVASGSAVGAGTEHDSVALATTHQAVKGAGRENIQTFLVGVPATAGNSSLVSSGKGVGSGAEHDTVTHVASGLGVGAGTEHDTVTHVASGNGVGVGTEHDTVTHVASGLGVGTGSEHDTVALIGSGKGVGAGDERIGNFVVGAQMPGLSRLVVSGKGVPAGTEHDAVALVVSGKGIGAGAEHDSVALKASGLGVGAGRFAGTVSAHGVNPGAATGSGTEHDGVSLVGSGKGLGGGLMHDTVLKIASGLGIGAGTERGTVSKVAGGYGIGSGGQRDSVLAVAGQIVNVTGGFSEVASTPLSGAVFVSGMFKGGVTTKNRNTIEVAPMIYTKVPVLTPYQIAQSMGRGGGGSNGYGN